MKAVRQIPRYRNVWKRTLFDKFCGNEMRWTGVTMVVRMLCSRSEYRYQLNLFDTPNRVFFKVADSLPSAHACVLLPFRLLEAITGRLRGSPAASTGPAVALRPTAAGTGPGAASRTAGGRFPGVGRSGLAGRKREVPAAGHLGPSAGHQWTAGRPECPVHLGRDHAGACSPSCPRSRGRSAAR